MRIQNNVRYLLVFSRKTVALYLCFLTTLVLLVLQIAPNVRDVPDGWILEGILPYFLVFVGFYSITVLSSNNLKAIALTTSVFLVAVNLIPNLKYVFIYGYNDPLAHYGFIEGITSSGFVPTSAFYSTQYGTTPGMQILVSVISLFTGLNVSLSMKFFLTALPFVLPLATYFVITRLKFPFLLGKAVLISLAISFPITYMYTGTISVYPLSVLFVYTTFVFFVSKKISRSDFVLGLLLGIGVIICHDVTTFFLSMSFLVVLIILRLVNFVKPSLGPTRPWIFLILIFLATSFAHFVFSSNQNFSRLLIMGKDLLTRLFSAEQLQGVGYYQGFYTLTLLERVEVLFVRFAHDAISFALMVPAALTIMVRARSKFQDTNLRKFYQLVFLLSFLAFSVFVASLFIRPLESRGTYYVLIFSPFLVGLTLSWLFCSKTSRSRNVVLAIATFSLITTCMLQVYPFQPLIPRVSSNPTFYVIDWRAVSAIYDRSAINFIGTYDVQLSVVVDDIMRWQIYGLTDPSFQKLLTWDSTRASIIVVATDPAVHIVPSGRDAITYFQNASNLVSNKSILYTNGKTYVLLNYLVQAPRV